MPSTLSDSITRIASDRQRTRHPPLVIALHWGTLAAIVISVAAMFVRDAVEDSGWRQALLGIHRQLGLLVLIGVGLRILVRLTLGLIDHAPDMSTLLRWAARF